LESQEMKNCCQLITPLLIKSMAKKKTKCHKSKHNQSIELKKIELKVKDDLTTKYYKLNKEIALIKEKLGFNEILVESDIYYS